MNKTLKYILIAVSILLLILLYIFNLDTVNLFVSDLTNTPKNITITNIDDNSFTVSWYTKNKDQGYVLYSTEEISNSLRNKTTYSSDDRGQQDNIDQPTYDGEYYTHHVTVSDLDPKTTYNFKISNGTRIWDNTQIGITSNNLHTTDLFVQTTKKETQIKNPIPLYGKNTTDEKINTDSIIYIVNDETDEVSSTTVDNSGYWILDLTNATIKNQRVNIVIQTDNNSTKYQLSINYPSYANKRVDINIEQSSSTKIPSKVYASSINCNQSVADQSIPGTKNAVEFEKLASNWVSGAGKNYAKECYNDTVCTAKKAGINPTFALLVWVHESAASNYTFASSPVEDFGIHIPSVPQEDYKAQITKFTQLAHENPCSNLSFWDGWATNYLNGSCDPTEQNFLTGQTGPEYAAEMRETWSWVSSNPFPSKIKIAPSSAGCGGSSTGNCVEQCPGSDGVLRSCTPPEPNGDSNQSLCNSAGRVEVCGNVDYCCPSAGGKWTTDMSKCSTSQPNPETETYEMEFTNGLSLVSFPFNPISGSGKAMKASDFMREFSNKGTNNFSWIAEFKNNKWNIFTMDDLDGVTVGADFELKAGYGYMIRSEDTAPDTFKIQIEGTSLDKNPTHTYIAGWNLIGLGENETYKATNFIKNTAKITGVSRWDNSTATYKNIIIDEGGTYGEDFNMVEQIGYFVYSGTPPVTLTPQPMCCGLALEDRDSIKGDWEDSITSCDAFVPGRNIYGTTLLYATRIPSITSESACEKDFTGICCNTDEGKRWVEKQSCSDIVSGVTKNNCN